MKKLMLIIASLFLATSVASASPSQQMDFTSMNKADSQFLFNGSTKAIALSSQEMEATEGEWFWFSPWFYRAAFSGTRYLMTSGYLGMNTYASARTHWNNWW